MNLYFDGACRGNPGKSAGAFVLKDSNNNIVYKNGVYIPYATNNEAEYTGLIEGLKYCIENDYLDIIVYGDSKLVISQSNGTWKVNADNLKILNKNVNELKKQFSSIKFIHILRNLNKDADLEANKIIDFNN